MHSAIYQLVNMMKKLLFSNNIVFQVAEGEIQALLRKLSLLQDELKRTEAKLSTTSAELNVATTRVDEIARAIKTLETKNMIDEGSKFYSNTLHQLKIRK